MQMDSIRIESILIAWSIGLLSIGDFFVDSAEARELELAYKHQYIIHSLVIYTFNLE